MRKHPKSPKSNGDTVYKITDPYFSKCQGPESQGKTEELSPIAGG